MIGVTRTATRHGAIVLHADEQPARIGPRAVGEAHDGFEQVLVGQPIGGFGLELDVERFSSGDQLPQAIRRHSLILMENVILHNGYGS